MRLDRVQRCVVVAAALLLGAGAASAQAPASPEGYTLYRPPGPGPHPAALFVPGCYGFNPAGSNQQDDRTAEEFRRRGFIVMFVDYLARRHLASCERFPVREVGTDVLAAGDWLRAQSGVDPGRVAAVGWSYGGGAVLAALSLATSDRLPFSRAVLFYPDCTYVKPWQAEIPVLMLAGAADMIVSNRLCQMRASRSAAPGAVRIIEFPDAKHAFDFTSLPEDPSSRRGYAPAAAAAAWKEAWTFLGVAD